MRRFIFVVLLLLSLPAQAQELEIDVDELVSAAEDWAKDNLDDKVLELLEDVDRDRVRAFLIDLEGRLQTNSVYELAPLRESAREIAPFLEEWEETLPLAQWLRSRLDYLEVSEAFRTNKPQTKVMPPIPQPPPAPVQRAIWKRQFERRPIPARAEAFVPKLKKIFQDEKTPPELVWVAEVESSFNPAARSPVGAAGLFQLMKPTAKSFGLSTFLPDERTDPEKNGRAAAKYLRYLHNRFGNWPLALAAYNAGETRVFNLLKKTGGKDFESIADRLPAETQLYVPKCEAALQKREGVSLTDLKPLG